MSQLDEILELHADNFPGRPMGLSALRTHAMIAVSAGLGVVGPAQFLTACNSPSPKLTALEVRDGSSTFLLDMGGPWNDGLVIGPAADLALMSTVPCPPCTAVAWGYNSPCQPSACPPALPPESVGEPPVCQSGWVLLALPKSARKQTSRQAGEATPGTFPAMRLPVKATRRPKIRTFAGLAMSVPVLSHPTSVATRDPRITTWRRA